jgi:hypothetical protein
MNSDGTGRLGITFTTLDSGPAWSPDGKFIAFQRNTNDLLSVVVVAADGSSPTTIAGGGSDKEPDWQPITMGNVNCRSGVNSVDALLILQVSARLLETLACADRADVNDDGETDSLDAVLVLQFAAGLLDSLAA